MNRLLILLLFFCFSCSGQSTSKQAKYVQTPVLSPIGDYLKATYDDAFFKEGHFSYSGNGKESDTTKYLYTSETIIIEDTVRKFLRNCEATIYNDSLFLRLDDLPFSASLYELKIVKVKNESDVKYSQTFSIADSSYKPPVFKTIDQNIILDKSNYVKGDSLKGKLSIEILASYFWESKHTDTIQIYGLIKTVVK